MFKVFLLLVFALIISGEPPQICNKLRVSRFLNYQHGAANFTLSANLEIVKQENSSIISVSDVSIKGDLIYGLPDAACVDINSTQSSPNLEACGNSISDPFNFSIPRPSFRLHVHFPISGTYFFLYFGFADDGTFTYTDGTIFTPANSTFSFIERNENNTSVFSQTCTSFLPAPMAPSNAAKCKTFKTQISILNSTDNFSIYATAFMNWTFTDTGVVGIGNYSIPFHLTLNYYINDGFRCTGHQCFLPLKPGDKKVIFLAEMIEQVGWDENDYRIPFLGRIILRGNETLIAEGIPFSPENNCLFFNFPYSNSQVSTNQLCCIEFENS